MRPARLTAGVRPLSEVIVKAATVLELLGILGNSRIDSWVDGGWGVDALLGRETRPHDDLDLVVALEQVDRIREVLGRRGFVVAADELPVRFVLSHPELGRVDFHTVTFDADGGGVQPQPSGTTFRYPAEGFVWGLIGDRPVRCISAEIQVLCHLGYEPKQKDVHDMGLLHRAFGTELPSRYRRLMPEGDSTGTAGRMTDVLEIRPYDVRWAAEFEDERARLRAALDTLAVRIDHNGSTSVPGLAAKPVIDIQISVRRLHPIDAYSGHLAKLGYVHVPHPDDAFAPFFHRPDSWPHTHHIHVVASGSDEERRTLAFRDYLREHAEVARAYETLKKELAPRYSSSQFSTRQAYADAKGAFIEGVTRQALAAGYPRDL